MGLHETDFQLEFQVLFRVGAHVVGAGAPSDADLSFGLCGGKKAFYYSKTIRNKTEGHVAVVKALLENDNLEVNAKCTDGKTALYIASQNGHDEVVRLLLQHSKVDVNARCLDL